jgi:hypothetical protein
MERRPKMNDAPWFPGAEENRVGAADVYLQRPSLPETRMARTASIFLLAGLAFLLSEACHGTPSTRPAFRLEATPAGADTRLTLIAPPDLKVSARLKPALELPDGTVLRFDAPALTADSAYFASPATAVIRGHHSHVRGTLRASVCGVTERVCHSVSLRLES